MICFGAGMSSLANRSRWGLDSSVRMIAELKPGAAFDEAGERLSRLYPGAQNQPTPGVAGLPGDRADLESVGGEPRSGCVPGRPHDVGHWDGGLGSIVSADSRRRPHGRGR